MKHLRYDCMSAGCAGEKRHPQTVMRELGITYEHAIPQSLYDQWWLFNCQHSELPKYITEMKCDNWLAKQYELPEAYINDNSIPARQQEAVSAALEHGLGRYSGAMQKLADGGD